MIRDLSLTGGPSTVEAEVAIVGGGIAGLVLATRLAKFGVKTIVLESGGLNDGGISDSLNAVENQNNNYLGATQGRFRGLGGTSTRWGGALLPFPFEDLRERLEFGLPAWPVDYSDLMSHQYEIEKLFSLVGGPYEVGIPEFAEMRLDPEAAFVAREAKWPTFRRRNLAKLLRRQLEGPDVDVWLNATVRDFDLDISGGRVTAVVARDEAGHSLRVTARRFVLCAGAIESTRLLLNFDRKWSVVKGRALLGRRFQDHLSLPLAKIATENIDALNRLAGFRFDGSTMRSLRFEFSAAGRRAANSNAGFVHIAPRALRTNGFDAVRDIFRSVQRGRLNFRAVLRALEDVPYLTRLLAWRYLRSRLYWPRPSSFEVHFVVEQTPHFENRISLSDRTDRFDVPMARIEWQPREADALAFRALAVAFDEFWRANLSRFGKLEWLTPPTQIRLSDLALAGDIYHPVGSTAMGRNANEGVVDGNLCVHGVPNLYVAASSAFPTGGTSNPTMTLLLMVLRLAMHLRLGTSVC